jgi:hypothetical protein
MIAQNKGDLEFRSRVRVSEYWSDNSEVRYSQTPIGTRLFGDPSPGREWSVLTGQAALG